MAAPIRNHVRLRIYFENSDIPPSWLLVELTVIENIKDLKKRICKRFLKQHHELELTLQDCVLPEIESSIILRDDDAIHVRICSNSAEDTDNGQETVESVHKDCHAEEALPDPDDGELINRNKKKVKKRKHKSVEIGSNDEECVNYQKKKKKKKKNVLSEDECDQDNYNSLSSKRLKVSEVDVEDVRSVKPDDAMPVSQASRVTTPKEATTESSRTCHIEEESNDTVSKLKKKRKRRRKKKNSDKSQNIVLTDGLLGVDVNCSSREIILSNGRARSDMYQKNKHKEWKQKPVNNHTLFSSSDTSDLEGAAAKEADGNKEWCQRNEMKTIEDVKNSVDNNDQTSYLETMKQKLLSRVQEIECQADDDRISPSGGFEIEGTGSVQDSSYDGSKKTETYVQHVHREMTTNSMENDVFGNLTPEQGINITSEPKVISTVKSSVLPNGVPVYSRQRQRGKFSNAQRLELTKQQQLNTKLTNKSILLKGNGDSEDQHDTKILKVAKQSIEESQITNNKDCIVENVGKDYSKFPQLQGTPRSGDSIAYKILEMSETYTPEISEFKEGVVLEFDHTAQMVKIQVKQGNSARKRTGKFDVTLEDDDNMLTNVQTIDDEVLLPWSSIFETRLLM